MEQVHAARHQHDLCPPRGGVVRPGNSNGTYGSAEAGGLGALPQAWHVHLDHAHVGVGGDDSWSPSVHEQYLVPPGLYRWGLVLAPCGSAAEAEWAGCCRTA